MQFANSDIEDLKIVDEEASGVAATASAPTPAAPVKTSSIHDDPAIVSAVMSSSASNKESSSSSNRLVDDLQKLTLSHEQSKKEGKRSMNNGIDRSEQRLF